MKKEEELFSNWNYGVFSKLVNEEREDSNDNKIDDE